MGSEKPKPGVEVVARNKRARFDYSLEETFEAGLELVGSEVKSLREGKANLSDSYAMPERHQIFLHHLHIGPYKAASVLGHAPLRPRRLLLHRKEIEKLMGKVKERGYALIPTQVYFKNGWAKVEIGLARGKTHEDRREDIKERETRREVERALDPRTVEKRRRLEEALAKGVVMIHLDARKPGVRVPAHFATDYHLRLNLSLRYDPPDLATSAFGVRETLRFNGEHFPVAVPWSAIFAITGASSDESAWLFPEDMPRELFEAAARHFGLTGEEVAISREEAAGKPLRPAVPQTQENPAPPTREPSFKPRLVQSGEDGLQPDDPSPKGPRRSHLRVVK
jgi:SsrA-binding protein